MAFNILSLPGQTRRLLAFAHDMVATAMALSFAYYIRYQAGVWDNALTHLLVALSLLLPTAAIVYYAVGLYRGIWRFASIPDLAAILKAVTVLCVGLIVADFIARETLVVPRSVVAVYWLAQCALLGGPRLLYRIYRDQRIARTLAGKAEKAAPVLILGASTDAEVLIRSLETTARDSLFPVGVLSKRSAHVGQIIRGVPVLGTLDNLEDVVRDLEAKNVRVRGAILDSDTLAGFSQIEDIIGRARRIGLSVERPQFLRDQGRSAGYLSRFQPVQIEDVIGRKAREIDLEPMRRLISGRRVLVTGGGGSIGAEICRQIARLGCERLMIVENSEFALYGITQRLARQHSTLALDPVLCDIRMRADITRRIGEFHPDIVFHAAAYKHVPMLEHQPREAVNANILGTINVADAAVEAGAAAFVLISSDKAVYPVSVMGATKRAAEIYCEALGAAAASASASQAGSATPTRFVCVRFGNVLGTSGSVVPLFNEQIAQGGPLTITHPEMERYFMTVSEAVSLVLLASAHGIADTTLPSILALDMGEPIRIIDLAERMIRLAGLEPGRDIRIDFIGLREGERLRETLFANQEDLGPTSVEGVFAAKPKRIDRDAALSGFRKLAGDFDALSAKELRERLAALVPEFTGHLAAAVEAAVAIDDREDSRGTPIDRPAA
ncbi:MAG: polysaccharide biosynthesis protein [Rhodobiaceae bacterium]|nr:polysaccharide biosynthesis protein [Rhodobiaceae bacterium]MCC0054115.1 polysaccharide biosynthesis protein [Rhodobiaceae bacterium]